MAEVFAVLRSRPDVAWFARMNSGASMDDDRYVTFYRLYIPQQRVATKGISDYIGQLCDGTFFAIKGTAVAGRNDQRTYCATGDNRNDGDDRDINRIHGELV